MEKEWRTTGRTWAIQRSPPLLLQSLWRLDRPPILTWSYIEIIMKARKWNHYEGWTTLISKHIEIFQRKQPGRIQGSPSNADSRSGHQWQWNDPAPEAMWLQKRENPSGFVSVHSTWSNHISSGSATPRGWAGRCLIRPLKKRKMIRPLKTYNAMQCRDPSSTSKWPECEGRSKKSSKKKESTHLDLFYCLWSGWH